jgi:hypothetical protein
METHMVTEEEFKYWYTTAQPGDVYVYHTGDHLFGLDGRKRPAARQVLELAQRGELFIAQRRLATGEFQYQAMRLDERMRRKMKSWYH